MSKQETRYYKSFEDDFTVSKNQNKSLPKDYKWIDTRLIAKIISAVVYSSALIFSSIYCRLFLHTKIVGKEKIKNIKGSCFIYGNHTQPIGDVFIPAHCAFPKRIYTVVSTANYGIPIISTLLPYLGALPVVETIGGMKELNNAIKKRVENGNPIVIFPEAHVWEYCSFIRPYSLTSFKYPAKFNVPSVAMTACYTKSRFYKKPKMTVYIDGPFHPTGDNIKEKAQNMHKAVYSAMLERSKLSNVDYIKYAPEKNKLTFFNLGVDFS